MLRTLYEVLFYLLVISIATAIAYFSFGAMLVYGAITFLAALIVTDPYDNTWTGIAAQAMAIVLIVVLATAKILYPGG